MSKKNSIRRVFCTSEGVAIDREHDHHFYQPSGPLMQRLALVVHFGDCGVRPVLGREVGWIATAGREAHSADGGEETE